MRLERVASFALLALASCPAPSLPAPLPAGTAARWAELVCPTAIECDCDIFESVEACEAHVLAEFERLEPTIRRFDEECFEKHLTSGLYDSCAGGMQAAEMFSPGCPAFYGDAGPGEACESPAIYGLLDVNGTCGVRAGCHPQAGICRGWEPPPSAKSEGDACADDLFWPCVDPALYCHVDECRPLVEMGEPCVHADACGQSGYCQGLAEGAGTCALKILLGEPCDPSDVKPCFNEPEASAWCNPSTQRCEVPIPAVCQLF